MTVKLRLKPVIQTNSQIVIKEMYPNETAEHHRGHRCRNKEANQFCYDPISKYRGNLCGYITMHHTVWAGFRSWVSRHLSLHLSIRGDEVRVRSCLIFNYRIRPKKQCILEKHSNLLQKYDSCRLLLTITHTYLSSHETRKHRHIFARVAAFWQRVFQTLPNLDVHPGVAVYHTLKIFSSVNVKDLLMPHTKFQVCTLKINTTAKKSHYFGTGVYNNVIKSYLKYFERPLRPLPSNWMGENSNVRVVWRLLEDLCHIALNWWSCKYTARD